MVTWLIRKRKFVALAVIALVVLAISFFTYQGWRIASPSKRAIQDYHKEWLESPEQHGVIIKKTVCLNGQVPTLVVEPSLPLGARGKKIREQLREHNVELIPEQTMVRSCDHTVVLLHGRNGRKEDLLAVAERFCAVGLRCILVDLPAHGESSVKTVKFGATDWEQDLPYRVLLECSEKFNFSPAKASLWGMSMGGSFANSAVADTDHGSHWRSLVIVCSFDRLDLLIKEHCCFDWLTSYISLVSNSFDGVDLKKANPAMWVKEVTTPVLVVHGDEDDFIPAERGRNLFESYASDDKKWVIVPGGNHSDILITPMPLYAEMIEWILVQ